MPPLVRDNYSTEPSSGEEETLPQHNQAAVPEIPNKPQAPVSKTLEMDDIFSSDDTPLPTKPAEPMTDEPPTTKRRGRPRKTIPTQPVARDVDLNEPLAPNRRTKARNFADMDIDEYQPLAPRRETRKRSTADVTESIDEDEDGPLPPRRRSGKKPLAGSSTGSFEKDKASTPRDDASYIPNTWKYAVVVPVRKRIKSTDAVEYVEISGYDAEIPEAEISDEYMPDAEAEKAPKAEEKTPRTRTSILRMSTLRTSDKRPSPYNRASATPSETPTTASEAPAGPNNAPAGPKKNTTDLDAIRRKDPQKFMLYWYRKVIQDRINKVRTQGLMSLEHSDIDVLGRVLKELAYCSFGADPSGLLKETKLRVAVRKLINTAEYGDDISGMAKKLLDRWNLGDFEPGPISNDDIGLLEDDDGDDDGEATSIKVPKALLDLLKGIIRFKSPGGRLTMKLDPNYPKRDCNIFGHNGLNVGDWWPYQLCALRDGAHGSRQGGIAGRMDWGCYSIVVSAESEYHDLDNGQVLLYSGTHGDPATAEDSGAQMTNATKTLIMSMKRGKPVRVIRKGPGDRGSIYPSCGYRYDGLYMVVNRSIVPARGPGERDFYQFRLNRNDDQPPLSQGQNRPTSEEYRAYQRLVGSG